MNSDAIFYQPYHQSMLVDPYPFFEIARRTAPVFYSAEIDHWLVSRHEDVKRIFLDHDTFSAKNTLMPISSLCEEAQKILKSDCRIQPALGNQDRPRHRIFRMHLMKVFTAQLILDEEPVLRSLINSLIDKIEHQNEADLIDELIFQFPAQIILKMLGFLKEDMPMLIKGGKNRNQFIFGHPGKEEQIQLAEGMASLFQHCFKLVESRTKNPQNDITSTLIALRDDDNQSVFTTDEIASILFAFFTAGHETTASLIGNAIRQLLTRRSEWEKICKDPTLIPNTVEEALRHDSSVIGWRRLAKQDVEIAGVTIPKDSQILLLLGAANRDDALFDEPDRFDISRGNAKEHLSFGKGIHTCFGNVLARLEIKVALEELSARLPGLQLASEQTFDYMPNVAFRTLYHLNVKW